MKKIVILLLLSASCFAEMNLFRTEEPKISVQNKILAKVNGTTISLVDVMKKMDLLLHQNYPQFADSPQARFQFYASSWRPIFMEMIDTELILSDANDKEVKLTDGEIREEMENRFGPNVLLTLDKIGLSYDDAWNMIKKELLVRRMMWFFVQSKAMQSITPQDLRQSYQSYLKNNPPYKEWKYRVITLRTATEGERFAQEARQFFVDKKNSPESLIPQLKEWEQEHPNCSLQVSNEYCAKDSELSDSHKASLSSLKSATYGDPIAQISRADGKTVYRMFYLYEKTDHPAPSFEELAPKLKNELTQKSMTQESTAYLQKLRKHYGFDPTFLKETLPDNLQPFALN